MKDVKMSTRGQTKDAKIAYKIEREHKIRHNTPTLTTDVSTVEATTRPMIVQQDNSIRVPPANNPVGSTGTNYQYSPQFQQPSSPQHSQQSANCWIIYIYTDGQQPAISASCSRSTPKTTSSTGTTG